ncbi:hypothetical protein [Streptomyces sp. NPDC059452]|uniref:hypothetical protein n=1 Tax=Streptomyces sp. NPDC059452 TaxID=3346835 RepID=UPI003681C05C
MTKGHKRSVVAYVVMTLLGAAAVAWAVIMGLARMDLLGNAVEVRLAECHREGGGRGGSYNVCSGPHGGDETQTVEVRYEGRVGEVVRAVRTPWGNYTTVEKGPLEVAISVLMPVIPAMATVGAGALTVREVRRVVGARGGTAQRDPCGG